MPSLTDVVISYPAAIYTVLLGVVLIYWLLALVGLVDFEHGGPALDLDADADLGEIDSIAAKLVAFGLGGVPFSIVASLLVLTGWTITCAAGLWLLPLVPTAILSLVAGTVALLVAITVSIPLTAIAIRPMRRLFVTHSAVSNASLVGRSCRILTGKVDESFGRAEVETGGASINIRVVADSPNTLKRGGTAIIIDYDPASARYRVQAEA